MEPLANPPLRKPGRRAFLWSLATAGAGFGIATQPLAAKSDKDAETVYRIRTPECELRMSVEYFANSEIGSFRFRDSLAERAFCLSSNGEEGRAAGASSCVARFSGSVAIAHYHFRSRLSAQSPLRLRERCSRIRIPPTPPDKWRSAIPESWLYEFRGSLSGELSVVWTESFRLILPLSPRGNMSQSHESHGGWSH